MPISGPSSFPPTIREFIEHWTQVDAFIGGTTGLVLTGGIGLGNLEEWRDDLDTLRDAVTDARVDRTLARQELNGSIAPLQARMVEFNGRVRADLPGSAFARSLGDAFAIGDGEEAVRTGLRAMSRLWLKINALTVAPDGVTLPLVLLGGYTLATFDADRLSLRTAYGALSDAEVDLKLARERRNDLQDVIYPALKAYRLKVPVSLPAGNALIDSLPALTPPEGHTPEPVAAVAVWDGAEEKAKITWGESSEPTLKEYEVRGVPGEEYEAEDEVVLGSILPGQPRELLTGFALGTPGVTVGYKVYVVLKTGNERGSEGVFVTRPG